MTRELIIAILACLTCGLIVKLRGKKRLPYPPGPPADPLIGHLRVIPFQNQASVFRHWAKQYGNIIHVQTLGRHVVVLGDVQTAVDLLEKRSANYSDRTYVLVAELVGSDDLPFMSYGDRFRRQRKVVHSFLTKKACSGYMSTQLHNAHLLATNLLDHPGQHETCLNMFASGTLTQVVFGHQLVSIEDEWLKIMDQHNAIAHYLGRPGGAALDIFPFLQYFPSWFPGTDQAHYARKWRNVFRRVFDTPYEDVQRRLAEGSASPSFISKEITKLDAMERVADEDIEEVKKMAGAMLRAGNETTWSTLSIFLLNMTIHPDIQLRAQADIDRVVGTDRLPEFSDYDHLPYIDSLVQELLRWHPTLPLGLPHRAVDDDVYNGYFIPKGSVMLPNILGMSQDESRYQNPTEFDPSRFLPRPEGRDEPPFDSVAFGFGRRICPGRHFAFNSLWIAVATCLASLHISKEVDEDGVEIAPKIDFTSTFVSRPKPFGCKVTPRSRKALRLLTEARIAALDAITQEG